MLYHLPTRTQRFIAWLTRRRNRRPGSVMDIRDLSPYLQSDIGVTDTSRSFRKGR